MQALILKIDLMRRVPYTMDFPGQKSLTALTSVIGVQLNVNPPTPDPSSYSKLLRESALKVATSHPE
jgi:hypothetical protein